jgi:hypothetical protein
MLSSGIHSKSYLHSLEFEASDYSRDVVLYKDGKVVKTKLNDGLLFGQKLTAKKCSSPGFQLINDNAGDVITHVLSFNVAAMVVIFHAVS